MPLRRPKIIAIVFALWVAASLLSFATGLTFPALFNRAHEVEFGCSEPTIVDGIWIRPCINSSSRGFTIPLLYSSSSSGSPFSIGLSVVDYADNRFECHQLVVTDLVVTIDGTSIRMLPDGDAISADFNTFYSGTESTKAEAYVSLGDLLTGDDGSSVTVDATLQIRTTDGIINESVSGHFQRGGWQGTWFILEALFPHA